MNSRRSQLRLDDRARPKRRRRRWLWLTFALVVGIGLYAFAGFIVAPRLVEQQLAAFAASEPGRTASSGTIRFNPFTLMAEVTALDVADARSGSRAAADRIVVELAARSLLERRPVIGSIAIERPQLTLAAFGQLPELVRLARDAGFGDSRIENLMLADGTLAIGTGPSGQLERIDIALTDYDGRAGVAAPFRLDAATATGGHIAGSGRVATSLDSAAGTLQLNSLPLTGLSGSLQGRFDLAAGFSVTGLATEPALSLTDAAIELSDLAIQPGPGLRVFADQATAAGDLMLVRRASGVELDGRVQTESTRIDIEDTRVRPQQSFVLDTAAAFVANSPGNDGLSLSLSAGLRGAGPVSLTLSMPPGTTGNLKVSIELTQVPAALLSPYVNRALDRALMAGTADIGLDYVRNNQSLDGTLHIVGHALELAPVPAIVAASANAGDDASPEMAVALLEDRDRRLDLNLPFAGSSGTVFDAVTAALSARIAALTDTPFAALGTAADGDAALADAIPFLPGDAALSDVALLTIDQLAAALTARPRLGIRILGGSDPEDDRDALARQQIELHVQLATAGPGNPSGPAPIDFDSPRVRDVLDEFAGERLPAARVAALMDRYNCDGAFSEICQRSYYRVVFDALVANEEIAATTLNRLGRFRGQSIADALRQRGIEDARIEVGSGSVVATPYGIGLPVDLVVADTSSGL